MIKKSRLMLGETFINRLGKNKEMLMEMLKAKNDTGKREHSCYLSRLVATFRAVISEHS